MAGREGWGGSKGGGMRIREAGDQVEGGGGTKRRWEKENEKEMVGEGG